jgi:hypothetical protein
MSLAVAAVYVTPKLEDIWTTGAHRIEQYTCEWGFKSQGAGLGLTGAEVVLEDR